MTGGKAIVTERLSPKEVMALLDGITTSRTILWYGRYTYMLENVCIRMTEWSVRVEPQGDEDSCVFESAYPVCKDELLQALAKAVLMYG